MQAQLRALALAARPGVAPGSTVYIPKRAHPALGGRSVYLPRHAAPTPKQRRAA